jgi:Tetracyclin repressor-like, C-terminal domain
VTIAPELRRRPATYRQTIDPEFPLGVAHLMITCWRQIYGLLSMAVHGNLAFAYEDYRALFEDMMDDLIPMLGLQRSPRPR